MARLEKQQGQEHQGSRLAEFGKQEENNKCRQDLFYFTVHIELHGVTGA